MKIFKKLFIGFLAIFAGFLFSRNAFAKPYDVIIKKDNFAEISVAGINESNKMDFYYVCQSFYNIYRDSYIRLFERAESPLIINSKKTYSLVKSCRGPNDDLYADKCFLCGEIDPNRGDREETGEDRVFLAEYGKLDKRLADTLHNILSENICQLQ